MLFIDDYSRCDRWLYSRSFRYCVPQAPNSLDRLTMLNNWLSSPNHLLWVPFSSVVESECTMNRPMNLPSVRFLVDKQQCTNEQDEKCRQQRQQIEQIADLCANDKIQFTISTNSQLAEKQFNIYGALPKLCFFRDGFPIIYSGRKRPRPEQRFILVPFQVQLPISINSRSGSAKHGNG